MIATLRAKLRAKRPDLDDKLGTNPTLAQVQEALAVCEAPAMTLSDRLSAVRQAVAERFSDSMAIDNRTYAWACMVYDDSVVYEKGTKLYQVAYSIDDAGVVTFAGDPKHVRLTPEPVGEAVDANEAAAFFSRVKAARPFDGYLLSPVQEGEAAPTGERWDIVVIEAGTSQNGRIYEQAVLEAHVAKYDGVPIFRDHAEQPRRFGRSVDEAIGFISAPRGMSVITEANGATTFAVGARANIVDPTVATKMLNAWKLGKPNLFGFSHAIEARRTPLVRGGQTFERIEAFNVKSVDLVMNPAAGGRVLNAAVESAASPSSEPSVQEGTGMLKELLDRLKKLRPDLAEALGEKPTETQVLEALDKALAEAPAKVDTKPTVEAKPATTTTEVREAGDISLHRRLAKSDVGRLLGECTLPALIKERLRARFERQISEAKVVTDIPEETGIAEAIQDEVKFYGKLFEKDVQLPGGSGFVRVENVQSRYEKIQEAWNDFFDPKKPSQSVRELYIQTTGDRNFTGRISEAHLLREAISSTSFDQIMGDSVARRMLAYYAAAGLADWRKIVRVERVSDFRTQRRMRFGGYGNLSVVAERAPYPALTTPSDEEATYSVSKRGGTESLSLEAIRNDDVGAVRDIPRRLGMSAAQTVHEFVWDLLANNPTIYDSVALVASGHTNIVTTALSDSNIEALRLKMKQQTDMSNGKRLGIVPRYLIVPNALEKLAWQLTRSPKQLPDSSLASTAEPAALSYTQQMGLEPIVVEYWTDTDNYFMVASPDRIPTIEVAFLDGKEDPELFVQDMPNVGSMFFNDTLTWKLRHIYGGAWMDFRGVAGGIVP